MITTPSERPPIYKPCGETMTIRISTGAYSFAKCTLLLCDNKPHEGEHKFAVSIQTLMNDQVIL